MRTAVAEAFAAEAEVQDFYSSAIEAKTIGKFDEVCKVGLDLWQVKSGTIFDNFMITDDPAAAKKAGEDLWAVTKDAEKKMKDEQDEEERKKAEAEAKTDADEDDEDLDDIEEDEEEEKEDEVIIINHKTLNHNLYSLLLF